MRRAKHLYPLSALLPEQARIPVTRSISQHPEVIMDIRLHFTVLACDPGIPKREMYAPRSVVACTFCLQAVQLTAGLVLLLAFKRSRGNVASGRAMRRCKNSQSCSPDRMALACLDHCSHSMLSRLVRKKKVVCGCGGDVCIWHRILTGIFWQQLPDHLTAQHYLDRIW